MEKNDMFHVEHGNRCAIFAVDSQEKGHAQNVAVVDAKHVLKKEKSAIVQMINSGDHSQKDTGGKERMRAEMPRRPTYLLNMADNPSRQI